MAMPTQRLLLVAQVTGASAVSAGRVYEAGSVQSVGLGYRAHS